MAITGTMSDVIDTIYPILEINRACAHMVVNPITSILTLYYFEKHATLFETVIQDMIRSVLPVYTAFNIQPVQRSCSFCLSQEMFSKSLRRLTWEFVEFRIS